MMQNVKVDPGLAPQNSSSRWIMTAIVMVVLGIAALYINNAYLALRVASLPPAVTVISQKTLEEQYGLRVNLVAVTAAGGMVDLRLKMEDGEKARLLLQDKKHFPSLQAANQQALKADEDTTNQEIKFATDGGLFVLFPNSGNSVKPGSTVTIIFGDLQLEPVTVK
jgi:hypothetical protein